MLKTLRNFILTTASFFLLSQQLTIGSSVSNRESNFVVGGNTSIKGNNVTVKGSNLMSDEGDIEIDAKENVLIMASEDSSRMKESSEEINLSYSFGTNGNSFSGGYGNSSAKSNSTSYNNSFLGTGGKIKIKSGNDTKLSGANVEAGEVDLEVGNDLTIESKQNRSYSSNRGMSISLGGGSGGLSGGFSSSNGYSDRTWVDNQTSIIGRRSVSVKAEGKTHIKGGEIANKKVDGTDGGNLNISTGSLTYEDIKDSHYSKQQGSGVNIGGTSTISMTNKGSDKEGITRSTIGLGNIKIADQSKSGKIVRNRTGIFEVKTGEEELGQGITGLNREINKSQEIRSDKITGALDFEVSVDNRWFSKKGRDEMKEQLASLPKNMALSVYGAINTASNMVETGVTNLKKNGASIKDTFLAKQNEQKVAIDRLNNKESRDIINNVGNEEQSAKNIEKALQVGVKVGEGSKVYYDEKSKEAGFHDDRNGDTYVNLAKGENSEVTNATNRDSLIGVDAHERGHRVSDNEDFVDMVGREAKTAWKIVNFITGGKGTGDGKVTKESWANANGVGNNDVSNNSLLNKNNNKASSVAPENRNNLTIFVHGTNSSPEQADKDFIKAVGETFNEKVEQLRWSGENIKQARTEGADQLKTMVDSHEFKEGEKLNIVQHSHGGNVVKEWSQEYEGEKKVDNMVFLGTPHRKDYQLNYDVLDKNANKINLYDIQDIVQIGGHSDGKNLPMSGLKAPFIGNYAQRTLDNFENVEIYQTEKITTHSIKEGYSFSYNQGIGPIDSHLNLDTKSVWDKNIKNIIQNDKNN